MKDIKILLEKIKSSETIIIAGHTNPDGDAISACFALSAIIFENFNKQPIVLLEEFPKKFNILGTADVDYDQNKEIDLFISVDTATLDRLERFKDVFRRASFTANIDHHATNENYADLNLIKENASSTCEWIYSLFNKYCEINKKAANALYSGIIFDTGRFLHKSTTAKTHKITAALIKKGAETSSLTKKLILTRTLPETYIFGRVLSNLKEVANGKIVYSCITLSDLTETGATYGDMDGMVEHLLNIKGVSAAALFTEHAENEIKISFRSKETDISLFAKAFGGGGHKLAAGAVFEGTMKEAVDKVIINLIKYMLYGFEDDK